MSGFTSLGKKTASNGSGINSNATGPFGTSLVSSLTPTSQATFVYGTQVNTLQWITASIGAEATTGVSEGIMSCTSGNDPYGSSLVRSSQYIKYRAGQGALCRITAIFDPGKPNTYQLAGIGNGESGYFFGRVGPNFGILHRESSKREIRTFTVSAQGSVTVDVTLGGVTKSFPIVGGSNSNQTAYLISQQDYSTTGVGWIAESSDSMVYFIASKPGPIGGTFGISVSGVSIVTATATVQAGVLPVETFISQSSWNIDTMDGNGASRTIIDPNKGNIYGIGYQFLGFGDPVFSIENPETGLLTDVHRIQTANARTSLVVRNPQMGARWEAINSGSAAGSVTVKGGSAGVFNEGIIKKNVGVAFSTGSIKSSISSAWVPLMTMRTNQVFNGQCCYGTSEVFGFSVGCNAGSAASNKFLNVAVFKNAALNGPVNFENIDTTRSVTSVDVSATSITIGPNTRQLKGFVVAANSSVTLQLDGEDLFVSNGETLTIAAQKGGSTDVDAALTTLSWFEDQ